MDERLVLGLDYGTDSVRAVVVSTADGGEVCTAVAVYPRWAEGRYCNPAANQFRQHPLDYLDALESVVRDVLATAPEGAAERIVGISVDTTGSTPVAVDATGTALSLKPEFAENPNAMFVLWKDHTAIREADEINHAAHNGEGDDYTRFMGGTYSSEWFWAKILHILREDQAVRNAAFSWVEHCDWLPAVLTGTQNPLVLKRSRCAAGHKAMWHQSWGGLPPESFLVGLDPLLVGLRERLYEDTWPADVAAGTLTTEWAERLGLRAQIPVGVGAFDCHMGAVGADVRPGVLTKVMGTSTCDIAVTLPEDLADRTISGICGQVDGSVVPGLIGLEAGQSAFGDLYAWFRDLLGWPSAALLAETQLVSPELADQLAVDLHDRTLAALGEAAAALPVGAGGISAVDWINGRRTPNANQNLKLAITGLSMGSDAPRLFRALVEATAFGSRRIIECFEEQGVPVDTIAAIGGIARKSPFVMQVCADVWNRPITVAESDQCCALGAAVFAAVIAGVYPTVAEAQCRMHSGWEHTYQPDAAMAETYDGLYQNYLALGAFVEQQTEAAQ